MNMDNPQQAEIEIAYAAGLFDGEGYVAAYFGGGKYRRSLVFTASVCQKKPAVLYWLRDRFGGGVYARSSDSIPEWRCSGHSAAAFLRTVLHHLIVKKYDVEDMLDIWENRSDRAVVEVLVEQRKLRKHDRDRAAAETK